MKKRTVWMRLAVGLLAVIALWSLGGCDSVLGSDDDSDDDSDGGSGGGSADTVTSWILDNGTPVEHPFDTNEFDTYRVAIVDKDDSRMTIIFYAETDDGVVQVAGGVLPYEVSGDELAFTWSHAWLDRDPTPPIEGITYSGKDWYEIPAGADAPDGGTARIDGDTLIITTDQDRVFDKITFSLPEAMVDAWDLVADGSTGDMTLVSASDAPVQGWGGLTYTYSDAEGSQNGSGYWQASGTTEGYFRQVYTEVSSSPTLEYWGHLSPYTLSGDELAVFMDFAKTVPFNYTRR